MQEVESDLMGHTAKKERCWLAKYPRLQYFLLETRPGKIFMFYWGASYLAIITVFQVYFHNYVTCPSYCGSAELCTYPIMFSYLITFELLINFIMLRYSVKHNRVDSVVLASAISRYSEMYRNSNHFAEVPVKSNDGDENSVANGYNPKYCKTCKMVVPQRCHHCPFCQYCVMKKDQHCYITGGCLGYANQRYYIVFVFWGIVGNFYSMLYMLRYFRIVYQLSFPFGYIGRLFPFAFGQWLFLGSCNLRQFYEVLLFTFSYINTVGGVAFLLSQFNMIRINMTTYERRKKQFNKSTPPPIMERLRHVFGPSFLLNFIFPLPFRNNMDASTKEYVDEMNKEI